MPISMEDIIIGKEYTRDDLVLIWGYKGRQAISRGVITPANDDKIILFVTKSKQKSETQYNDYFIEDGLLLHMEGEKSHDNDQRLINAKLNGDSIFLFYRDIHHTPFIYYGEVFLSDYKIYTNKPSIFILSTTKSMSISVSVYSAEKRKNSISEIDFIADPEGKKRISAHVSYERSLRNRAKAIEIYGTICKVCNFDFNEFYGEELANDFIEIHHVTPLSKITEDTSIDPSRDLIPVCSNCHSMLHRKRDDVISIEELRKIIKINKKGKKQIEFSPQVPGSC